MAALVLATQVVWARELSLGTAKAAPSRGLQPRSRVATRQRRRVSAVEHRIGRWQSSYSDHEATMGRDEPSSPMRGPGQPPTPLR
jgi:hypothetical protein